MDSTWESSSSFKLILEKKQVSDTMALMADLCRHFYTLGWVWGSGGAMSIKLNDLSLPNGLHIMIMSPSGIYTSSLVSFVHISIWYSIFFFFTFGLSFGGSQLGLTSFLIVDLISYFFVRLQKVQSIVLK